MEKLLDEMVRRGFSIMLEREDKGEEDPYRLECIVSSAGGMTKIGKGDTLALALIRALSYMVDTLEDYLVDTEGERDRALTLLHRNGMVVNMLDEREMSEMRKACPSAEKSEKPSAEKSEKPSAEKSEKPSAEKSEKPSAEKSAKKE